MRHLPNVYVFCVRNWSGARVNSWSISFRQAAQVGPSFFFFQSSSLTLSVTYIDTVPVLDVLVFPFRARFPPTLKLSCLRTHADATTDRISSYSSIPEGNNDQPRIRSLTRISGCCAPNNLQSFTHFSHTILHWANPAASPLSAIRLL